MSRGKPEDDLTGREFGLWKVLEVQGAECICRCTGCDNVHNVGKRHLKVGQSTACRKCSSTLRTKHVYKAGDMFGQWMIVDGIEKRDGSGKRCYLLRCGCGFEKLCRVDNIGLTSSCIKCANKQRHPKPPDMRLAGRKFGMLTVIHKVRTVIGKSEVWRWECDCDCGNRTFASEWSLNNQPNVSCGCQNHKRLEKSTKWRGCGEISGTYWSTLNLGAKNRDIKVEITLEYIWELFLAQNRRCAYTGRLLVFGGRQKDETTASLDRIDSDLDYVPGNVHWVHKNVNKLKLDLKEWEFIAVCEEVSRHMKKRLPSLVIDHAPTMETASA